MISGGLTDRLIGLVSLYTFCKEQSLPFKVHFVSPFRLEDYLLPNLYDWRINDDAISYCKKQSVPVLIRYISNGEMYYHYVLNKYLKRNKQIHVYANAMYKTKCFKDMFNELFRPCSFIQKQVDKHISNMQGGYVSVTFRFQQLLGDFKEGNYIVLPPPERMLLINKCLEFVNNIHKKHQDAEWVLVTSDSVSFLNAAKDKFSFVYIVPGVVLHPDWSKAEGNLPYAKSFIDIFMIANAKKAYNYSTGGMYSNSGFAKNAARIGGIEYENIHE